MSLLARDATRCPCRKKSETVTYTDCCGRYHRGAVAPTPEALMRSRYTAFALHDASYVLATWHASTRPAAMEFETGRDWYMLKVIATAAVGDTGTVSFAARSRLGGRTWALEEVSRFVRENGCWYYVEGLTNA
jgi:SEC-C motif domain protein